MTGNIIVSEPDNTGLLVNKLETEFVKNANPEDALQMAKYMKDHFIFYGIKSVERRNIHAEVFKNWKPQRGDLLAVMAELWNKDEREYQYVAMDIGKKFVKRLNLDDIAFLENLIVNKSWWDTVDMLAASIAGKLLQQDEGLLRFYMERWMHHENMWLRRTSLLCQLMYKNQTREDLLEQAILTNISSKEFFIRKAIGWSLRSYARINPNWVLSIVHHYDKELSALSKKEALKHLQG